MANWSVSTKHLPNEINGGKQYELKDRVSRDSLNALAENSFYAMNKSDEANDRSSTAEQKANEALTKVTESLGSSVFVSGVIQSKVDFSADPQQQINELNENKANLDDIPDTSSLAKQDLSNVTYPQIVADGIDRTGSGDRVRVSYVSSDGLTWYRIWASGWKECGGQIASGTNGFVEISLPLQFDTTNFNVLYTTTGALSSSNNPTYQVFNAEILTNNTVRLYRLNVTRKYYAFGY